jgi:hypothetical protein
MKIKVLLVSSLLLLSLFALNASSQKELALASRAAWAADPHAAVLNTPIGSNSSSGATTNPEQTEKKGLNQTNTTKSALSNDTSPKQQIETISVPGNWSLEMADKLPRNATLILFQNGDTVFGKVSIRQDNNTLTVAADGSVNANKLNLNLITLEKIGLYKLSMTVSADTAIGSYIAFNTTGSPSKGVAKGLRT